MRATNVWGLPTLCVLLSAVPAASADFTLEIFGNDNMDETIDESDIEYVMKVINGTRVVTNLTSTANAGLRPQARWQGRRQFSIIRSALSTADIFNSY